MGTDIGYNISVIKPRYDTVEVCLSNRNLFNWLDINEYFDRSLSIVSLYYWTNNGLSSADPRYDTCIYKYTNNNWFSFKTKYVSINIIIMNWRDHITFDSYIMLYKGIDIGISSELIQDRF